MRERVRASGKSKRKIVCRMKNRNLIKLTVGRVHLMNNLTYNLNISEKNMKFDRKFSIPFFPLMRPREFEVNQLKKIYSIFLLESK